ncbi:hypothetical protein LCGC14_0977390 [marine sediment metagenome]|uniref:Uncharacterized protein n=1 Tax=marine sediment metagenome TaxID=412755 RepID=A0A0F9RGE0_9ZZZZ
MILYRIPKVGQKRTKQFFAWRPRICSDGAVRWLETLIKHETYHSWMTTPGGYWSDREIVPLRKEK